MLTRIKQRKNERNGERITFLPCSQKKDDAHKWREKLRRTKVSEEERRKKRNDFKWQWKSA